MLLGAASRVRGDWKELTPAVLAEAKAEGYNVLNILVDDPWDYTDDDVVRAKRLFAGAGLEIGQTNGRYGGALISPNEPSRAHAIEFLKRMAGLTAKLAAPNTYLRPGSMNTEGGWLPHPENRSPAVFDRLVESARQACVTAEQEGVRLATEGGVVCPVYSARRMRDFIDAVGSKALGFNQDPVNFVASLDDAYDLEPFLQEFFDLLGDVTFGAHAKDFKIVNTLLVRFDEAEIGSGLIPHDFFLTQMQRHAPDAHVLIEHLPPNKFANAIREFKVFSDRAGIVWDEPEPPQV
jgi:sugar phosphate isomerase/epimerase